MKALVPALFLSPLGLVAMDMTALAIALVAAFAIGALVCYLLVTRPEVTPRVRVSKGRREFWLERLPPRLGAEREESAQHRDQA